MKKLIGNLVYKIMGWKLENEIDVSNVHSAVLVCGPHTSNWDFLYAVMAFWKMEIPMKMLIKDDWTKPWYGAIIKWMGGIGVDRSQRGNLTKHSAALLKDKTERLYLINTPEGTRSYSPQWKKGFYYIAKEGEVPILLAYCDYKKKRAGISRKLDPQKLTFQEILQEAEDFYADKTAKYPEKFNKNIALK